MTVTPLITAEEGFPALEQLVASAKDEVILSFRIFDPETRLRDPRLIERGLQTWADLLAWVTRRDVRLRLLLADFDPQFTQTLHRRAWANASGFADVVQGDAQILLAPHGQTAGRMWHVLMAPRLRKALKSMRAEDSTRLTPVQRRVMKAGAELRPATIHQKFAIADQSRCVIGGLDVNERRFDTSDHDTQPAQTWHDVSVAVTDADFTGALLGHFADCWNAALDCNAASLAERAARIDASTRAQSREDLRLLRTFSAPCKGAWRLAPQSRLRDHEAQLVKLFEEARHFIYIETQFLRHAPLVDALCNAALTAPELQIVLILPAAPERALFGGEDGWDVRHAHGLQMTALDRLRRSFGPRLAVLTPAQPAAAPNGSPSIAGAGPVYVHSKVLIVDNQVAVVGSANLNGRSMRWDSEASVLVRDAQFASHLFDRLAEKWLGEKASDPRQAATWHAVAATNEKTSPEERQGFLLPFPMARGKRFARRLGLLPDDMF